MKTRIFLLAVLILGMGTLQAQKKNKYEIPLIGSIAPAFKAETVDGTFNFPDDFGKNWKILFSHPRAYTPVCTSEILHLAKMQDQLDSHGIKVAIVSTDTKESQLSWKQYMEEVLAAEANPVKINFPFIDDSKADVSKLYGMLHEPVSTTRDVRGVFVINPDNVVEATFFYPVSIGRNLDELVRTVQALQASYANKLYTPANWKPGNDLLVPHYPYTEKELAENPDLIKEFYNVGSFLWYKKSFKSNVD